MSALGDPAAQVGRASLRVLRGRLRPRPSQVAPAEFPLLTGRRVLQITVESGAGADKSREAWDADRRAVQRRAPSRRLGVDLRPVPWLGGTAVIRLAARSRKESITISRLGWSSG